MTECIKTGDKIKITSLPFGQAYNRLMLMGIRYGTILEIVSIQPIRGPVTVKNGLEVTTIGRGLFNKIGYEKIKRYKNK